MKLVFYFLFCLIITSCKLKLDQKHLNQNEWRQYDLSNGWVIRLPEKYIFVPPGGIETQIGEFFCKEDGAHFSYETADDANGVKIEPDSCDLSKQILRRKREIALILEEDKSKNKKTGHLYLEKINEQISLIEIPRDSISNIIQIQISDCESSKQVWISGKITTLTQVQELIKIFKTIRFSNR